MTDFFTIQLKYVNEVERLMKHWMKDKRTNWTKEEYNLEKERCEELIKQKFIMASQQTWIKDLIDNGDILKDRWYSIDINPITEKTNIKSFYQDMISWKCKSFIYWECAIEQRGNSDETMGNGFHCHFNVISKYGFKQTLSIAQDYWIKKKYCNPESIQIKALKTKSHLDIRKNYIRGIKKIDKMDKIPYDIKMRDKYGFVGTLSSTG